MRGVTLSLTLLFGLASGAEAAGVKRRLAGKLKFTDTFSLLSKLNSNPYALNQVLPSAQVSLSQANSVSNVGSSAAGGDAGLGALVGLGASEAGSVGSDAAADAVSDSIKTLFNLPDQAAASPQQAPQAQHSKPQQPMPKPAAPVAIKAQTQPAPLPKKVVAPPSQKPVAKQNLQHVSPSAPVHTAPPKKVVAAVKKPAVPLAAPKPKAAAAPVKVEVKKPALKLAKAKPVTPAKKKVAKPVAAKAVSKPVAPKPKPLAPRKMSESKAAHKAPAVAHQSPAKSREAQLEAEVSELKARIATMKPTVKPAAPVHKVEKKPVAVEKPPAALVVKRTVVPEMPQMPINVQGTPNVVHVASAAGTPPLAHSTPKLASTPKSSTAEAVTEEADEDDDIEGNFAKRQNALLPPQPKEVPAAQETSVPAPKEKAEASPAAPATQAAVAAAQAPEPAQTKAPVVDVATTSVMTLTMVPQQIATNDAHWQSSILAEAAPQPESHSVFGSVGHWFHTMFFGADPTPSPPTVAPPPDPNAGRPAFSKQDVDKTAGAAFEDSLSDVAIEDDFVRKESEDIAHIDRIKREDRALRLDAQTPKKPAMPAPANFQHDRGSTHISSFWGTLAEEDADIEEALAKDGDDLSEYERLRKLQDAKVYASVSEINSHTRRKKSSERRALRQNAA